MRARLGKSLVLVGALVILSACSSGGGASYQAKAQQMADALFAGQFDEAKAMALEEYRDEVVEDIDQFAAIYEKYDFRQVEVSEISRPWGLGIADDIDEESDKMVDVTFQFRSKGSDQWKTGILHLRVKLSPDGTWGIAAIQLSRPTR